MQKRYILILALLSMPYTFAQQALKARPKYSRSIFTRTTTSTFPSTSKAFEQRSFKSSTSFPCPKTLKKGGQRGYATKQFETSKTTGEFLQGTQSEKFTGSKILKYAKENPKKVIGVVSGIATAGALHQLGKITDINYEIQELSNAVSFMNYPRSEKEAYELINTFIQKGIVNEKNVHGQTPVMIILSATPLSDNDKASMLSLLFNNGAIIEEDDKQTALYLALGLSAATKSIFSSEHQFRPELKTLQIILPYLNLEDVKNLKKAFTGVLVSMQKNLQKEEEKLDKLLKEKSKKITGFYFDNIKWEAERITRRFIKEYKTFYKHAQRVLELAENNLAERENTPTLELSPEEKFWQFKELDYPL